MATAFRLAVEAGRRAHRAGIMDETDEARASSPVGGEI
jgi:thiazole synthase ThiGH ThiG subunit